MKGVRLPTPEHFKVAGSSCENASDAREDERERFDGLLKTLHERHDYVVVDCPGNDTFLARHALSAADVLITPINDSFIDLDLLAKVGGSPPRVLGPSVYSQTVWEQKQARARTTGRSLDWIVLRNRLSPLASRNSRNVGTTVEQLATRIGFRICDGFYERVVFRQLFLQGLTVLDLREEGTGVSLSMSHLAARQEIKRLIGAVKAREQDEAARPEPAPGGRAKGARRLAAGLA
jgi:chromosome partitioning protein